MNQNDECNYFDANSQNASDMNLNCVNNRINGVDKYCKSEYKLYDNISRNSQYLQIKRDTDAGYNVQNTTPQIKKLILIQESRVLLVKFSSLITDQEKQI